MTEVDLVQQETNNMKNTMVNQHIVTYDKYETINKLLKVAKEVNSLSKNDIHFTCKEDKYKGWQGTMKPTH